MSVGTKSLLFGVHAFWWHPFVVFLAWCKLYGKLPTFSQLLGIILHDIGYWGCPEMDGPRGKNHPALGAKVVQWLVHKLYGCPIKAFLAFQFTAYHSASFADRWHRQRSALCAPDKYSVVFEPTWFYLFRARLSGELAEYTAHHKATGTDSQWFNGLKRKFKRKYGKTT
jgi:hypothetical protein